MEDFFNKLGGNFILFSPLIFLGFFLVAETILPASLKWTTPLKSFLIAFLSAVSITLCFLFLFLIFAVFLGILIGESDPTKRNNVFVFSAASFLITPIWMFLTSFVLVWLFKVFSAGKSALYAFGLTVLRFLVLAFFGLIIYLI